ncbi:MAG: RDD family protein [Bacteroidota bacterium]
MKTHEIESNDYYSEQNRSIFPSLKERVQAVLLDGFIILFIAFICFSGLDSLGFADSPLKAPLFILLFVFYDPLMVAFAGGTIGHKMSNLEVKRSENHEKNINLLLAILRFASKTLLGWISLLTITGNVEKRAIHDFVGMSVVLKKQKLAG